MRLHGPHLRRKKTCCSPGFSFAFSLVELTLVIAIISVIGAIAIPRWMNSEQRYQDDLAAQRVAADIYMAQERANHASTTVTLNFIAATNSYQIVGLPDYNLPGQTYTVNLGSAPYNATVSSVNFAGGLSLSFDGYGTPQQAGSLVVTVGGYQHTISVDSSSGRVTIQ